MNLLFPAFNFFATNKYAQWIGGALAVILFIKADRWHLRRKYKKEGAKQVEEKIRVQTDKRQQRAEEERQRVADLNVIELHKRRAADPNNRHRVRAKRAEAD